MTPDRNPHAGLPITDDDATIANALEDVSIPTLMLSIVHMNPSLTSKPAPSGISASASAGRAEEDELDLPFQPRTPSRTSAG